VLLNWNLNHPWTNGLPDNMKKFNMIFTFTGGVDEYSFYKSQILVECQTIFILEAIQNLEERMFKVNGRLIVTIKECKENLDRIVSCLRKINSDIFPTFFKNCNSWIFANRLKTFIHHLISDGNYCGAVTSLIRILHDFLGIPFEHKVLKQQLIIKTQFIQWYSKAYSHLTLGLLKEQFTLLIGPINNIVEELEKLWKNHIRFTEEYVLKDTPKNLLYELQQQVCAVTFCKIYMVNGVVLMQKELSSGHYFKKWEL